MPDFRSLSDAASYVDNDWTARMLVRAMDPEGKYEHVKGRSGMAFGRAKMTVELLVVGIQASSYF